MSRQLLPLASLMLMTIAVPAWADPLLYSVTQVPESSVYGTPAVAINNLGQYTAQAYGRAFLVNGYGPNAGQATAISMPGATAVNPVSVNDSGQVVGSFDTANQIPHAFLLGGGQMTDLTASAGIEASNTGTGNLSINDLGQVAGLTRPTGSSTDVLTVYDNGQTTVLGTPPGQNTSMMGTHAVLGGMNNAGQVALNTFDGVYLYDHGGFTSLSLSPTMNVGSIGQINAEGQVVGTTIDGFGHFHAFLYSNGVANDLGTLGGTESRALGMNDSGEVVGMSRTASGLLHAFLYQNGNMLDLNNFLPSAYAGVTLWEATRINNLGQIVAVGGDPSKGEYYDTFILTPSDLPPLAAPVNLPEPTTFTFLGLVVAGVGLRRALKRLALRGFASRLGPS